MGLKDKLINVTKNVVDGSKDAVTEKNELRKRQKVEPVVHLNVSSKKTISLRKKENGYLYIDNDHKKNLVITNYFWNGPTYEIQTHSVTTGTTKKKGKAGRVVLGAAAGAVINPVGAVVGAAAGAASRGKSTKNEVTNGTQRQVERPANATLVLRNEATGKEETLTFRCLSATNQYILSTFLKSQNDDNIFIENNNDYDPYEEVKKVKELLDMGIITEEKFNQKKKELLNL